MRIVPALLGVAAIAACGGRSANTAGDVGSDAGTSGQCTNTCPSAGATQCSGLQVQTCTAGTNGCLSWSAAAACGGDQYCSGSACVACNSNCSADGVTQCADAGFQRCNADAHGCKFLSAVAPCPQGQSCDRNQRACVTNALGTCAAPNLVSGGVSGPADAAASCVLPRVASSLPSGQVQSLGTHIVREADPMTFTVPPNTGSFTVMLQAVDAGTTVTLTAQGQQATSENQAFPSMIAQPDGVVVLDAVTPDDGPDAGIWQPIPAATTSAITAPNTSLSIAAWGDGGVPAGTWTLRIDDAADYLCLADAGFPFSCTNPSFSNQYDVTVLTSGPSPLPGTVDLGVYLVSQSTPALANASTAIASAKFNRMLSTLSTIYARAGICLGNVTVYDVPAWAKAKYSSIDSSDTSPCGPLDQMFTLSKQGVNELNIFLVDDIAQASSGGGQIVGIDGAIPAPSSFGGTVHSGAVVNASSISASSRCSTALGFTTCGPDEVAYIAAHEGGHWMGLFHPTEATGDFFDPISDTGTCRCTSCTTGTRLQNCEEANPNTSNPTFMGGADCNKGSFVPQCDGSEYLMFWLIDPSSIGNVSSHQSQVMRLNPVVH
jgi:hypothetical protein